MWNARTYHIIFLLLFAVGLQAQVYVSEGTTLTGAENMHVQGMDIQVAEGANVQGEVQKKASDSDWQSSQNMRTEELVISETSSQVGNEQEIAETASEKSEIEYTVVHADRASYHIPRQKNVDGSDASKKSEFTQSYPKGSWAHTLSTDSHWLVFSIDNSLNSNSYTHTQSKSYPHYSVLYAYENGTAILKPPTKELV